MGSRPAASATAGSSPNGDSPSGAGLRESDLFTAKSQHAGLGLLGGRQPISGRKTSDSSGRWECLVPRSLAGNTGPWPRDLERSGDRPKLTPNCRPQVRDCGPPRDSQEGSSLVQRDTRSSEAREKTIHHTEHRGLIDFFLTHPPPSPSAPRPAGLGSGSRISSLLNPNTRDSGFWGDANQSAGERLCIPTGKIAKIFA